MIKRSTVLILDDISVASNDNAKHTINKFHVSLSLKMQLNLPKRNDLKFENEY